MIKLKLIENARLWYKFISIQLGIIGTAIVTILVALPDFAYDLWQNMPPSIRDLIPSEYMPLIGVAIYVLAMVSRLVKQSKLSESDK